MALESLPSNSTAGVSSIAPGVFGSAVLKIDGPSIRRVWGVEGEPEGEPLAGVIAAKGEDTLLNVLPRYNVGEETSDDRDKPGVAGEC
jgi:hypothetical protein